MSGRLWTEKEIDYLKRRYKKDKASTIAKVIKREVKAVYDKASELNLTKKLYMRKWTDEETNYLVENYKNMTVEEIAINLDRSYDSVLGKVEKLRLLKGNKKYWTHKEIEYLKTNWEIKSNEHLSKELNRSIQSIKCKASKLGLGAKTEWYSMGEVSEILGISVTTIINYKRSDKIKYDLCQKERKTFSFKESHIKEFAKNHQHLWDSKRTPVLLSFFINKPRWLRDKIEADKNKPLRMYKQWDNDEDKELLRLYSIENKSIDYIANKMQRTESSIVSRASKLYLTRD